MKNGEKLCVFLCRFIIFLDRLTYSLSTHQCLLWDSLQFYNKRILRTLFSIEKNKTFQMNAEFKLVALGSRTKEQCIFTFLYFFLFRNMQIIKRNSIIKESRKHNKRILNNNPSHYKSNQGYIVCFCRLNKHMTCDVG